MASGKEEEEEEFWKEKKAQKNKYLPTGPSLLRCVLGRLQKVAKHRQGSSWSKRKKRPRDESSSPRNATALAGEQTVTLNHRWQGQVS